MAVEFAGLLVRVTKKIEDQDTAAGTQDFVGGLQRLLWRGGVVEGLAEKREIDCAGFNRRRLDVAEAVFEIREIVLLRELAR